MSIGGRLMKIPRGARRFLLALAVLGTGAGSVLVVRHAALADTCDLDPGQAAVFQEQLDRYRTASGAVGAMATVRHCDAVAGYGSGSTQLAPPAELSADTRFRVGSQTKMLVAAVVLQLVDPGQVGLDESGRTTSPEW